MRERPANFNRLVLQSERPDDAERYRRARWLSQLCEYWPLAQLARLSEDDIEKLVNESSHVSAAKKKLRYRSGRNKYVIG